MKKFVIALSLTVLIMYGLVGLYRYLDRRGHRIDAELHDRYRQQGRLIHLIKGLDFLIIEDPSALSNTIVGTEYTAITIAELMRNSKKGDTLMDFMNVGQNFSDVWGSPLRIRFDMINLSNQIAKVTAWSIGPNRIDENGKGDDLIESEVIGATQ